MSGSRDRADIVRLLTTELQSLDYVLAAWLEGADAQGRADRFSDIDLWLDVQDGWEREALAAVGEIVASLAPLELAVEVEHPHPHIRQAFFRPEGVPEYWLVDLCVQSHRREFAFRKGVPHEQVLVLFDRAGVILFVEPDEDDLTAQRNQRLAELKRRLPVSGTFVRKELARGRFLAALGAYQCFVLEPLVEALRLRHAPSKADFGLKHVSRDLPADAVARLQEFYKVDDVAGIERLLPEALAWLEETLTDPNGSPNENGPTV